jgi:hypothetical protein
MRGSVYIAALAVSLVAVGASAQRLGTATAQTRSQRRTLEVPKAQAPAVVVRRALTAVEKLAAARKLAPAVTGVLDTLTLTPRAPFGEGKGSLSLSRGNWDANAGMIHLQNYPPDYSSVSVIWTPDQATSRYLIDFEFGVRGCARWYHLVSGTGSGETELAPDAHHLTLVSESKDLFRYAGLTPTDQNCSTQLLAVELTRLK